MEFFLFARHKEIILETQKELDIDISWEFLCFIESNLTQTLEDSHEYNRL